MKKLFVTTVLVAGLAAFSGCVAAGNLSTQTSDTAVPATAQATEAAQATEEVSVTAEADSTTEVSGTEVTTTSAAATETSATETSATEPTATGVTTISLGDSIAIQGEGAAVTEDGVLISAAGTYRISGTLADGMIEVDAADATVELVLDGAGITNADGPAILFAEVSEGIVTLAEDTVNTLVDGGSSDQDAALYTNGTLTIRGAGELNVTANNKEGISSTMHINIEGGTIRVYALEDGLNANNDNVSVISISDGYLYIETVNGDGIDSNGDITITGGTVIAHGALADANGGLDADGDVTIDGGTVIATGAQLSTPVATSAQKSLLVSFNSTQAAGTLVSIQSAGNPLLTFAPAIDFQNLLYSAAEIAEGVSYDVYAGGASTGEAVDGFFTGGEVSGGTLVATITTESANNGGFGGPGGRRPMP